MPHIGNHHGELMEKRSDANVFGTFVLVPPALALLFLALTIRMTAAFADRMTAGEWVAVAAVVTALLLGAVALPAVGLRELRKRNQAAAASPAGRSGPGEKGLAGPARPD